MDPTTTPTSADQPTTEQVIDAIALKASEALSPVLPLAGQALAAGAQFEPIISGMVHLFIGLFKHHAKLATAAQ